MILISMKKSSTNMKNRGIREMLTLLKEMPGPSSIKNLKNINKSFKGNFLLIMQIPSLVFLLHIVFTGSFESLIKQTITHYGLLSSEWQACICKTICLNKLCKHLQTFIVQIWWGSIRRITKRDKKGKFSQKKVIIFLWWTIGLYTKVCFTPPTWTFIWLYGTIKVSLRCMRFWPKLGYLWTNQNSSTSTC